MDLSAPPDLCAPTIRTVSLLRRALSDLVSGSVRIENRGSRGGEDVLS